MGRDGKPLWNRFCGGIFILSAVVGADLIGCSRAPVPPPTAPTATVAEQNPAATAVTGTGSGVVEQQAIDVDRSGSAKVSYFPNVKVLESVAFHSLRGLSTDGMALVFDSAEAQITALKPGDVLMIKGLLARKVIATDSVGGETLVLTAPAALTDVIKDGHISLRAAPHFSGIRSAARSGRNAAADWSRLLPGTVAMADDTPPWSNNTRNPSLPVPTASVGIHGPSEYEQAVEKAGAILSPFKSLVDDWDVDWSATPAPQRINLELSMKKSTKGVAATVSAKGYLSDFQFITDIDVGSDPTVASAVRSVIKNVSGTLKNFNGAMDVTWTIGIDTPGPKNGRTEIKLPGAISIPLAPVLEGIPFFLEVSGMVIVEPAFTARKQITSGTYHITYDGYQNFKINKSAGVASDGAVTGQLDYEPQTGLSAAAPFGMVIGLGAPRIQLQFGGAGVFKIEGLKEAAKTVDSWAQKVAQRALSPEAYKALMDSGVSLSAGVTALQNTGATVYVRVVSTSATSHSGMSVIIPCSHTDFHFDVSVGASASALGITTGDLSKRIIDKTYTQNVPPGVKLCTSIGANPSSS